MFFYRTAKNMAEIFENLGHIFWYLARFCSAGGLYVKKTRRNTLKWGLPGLLVEVALDALLRGFCKLLVVDFNLANLLVGG